MRMLMRMRMTTNKMTSMKCESRACSLLVFISHATAAPSLCRHAQLEVFPMDTSWIAPGRPRVAKAIRFCVGMLADLLGQIGVDSPVAAHKAKVTSRSAFTSAPFTRKPELPTCGSRNRIKGYLLNIGNYNGLEALSIRVSVDERQRRQLEKCLLYAAASAFILHSPHQKPKNYKSWMSGKDNRAFFIPHVILVTFTALAAFCLGYGDAESSLPEILDMSVAVVGGKDTAGVMLTNAQQCSLAEGGTQQATTAHHLGGVLASAHVKRCIGAVICCTSYFVNVLPSLVYVGIGSHHRNHNEAGELIYMAPRVVDLRSPCDASLSCFACEESKTDEPEEDATITSIRSSKGHAADVDPASLPVVIDSEGRTPDMICKDGDVFHSFSEPALGARTRLATGRSVTTEVFTPMDMHRDASLNTTTFPPGNLVHRVMSYIPALHQHERGVTDSHAVSARAGNLRGSMRQSLRNGRVLLLDDLWRGAREIASDVDCCADSLRECNYLQRTETTFVLSFPEGRHNPARISAYEVPRLVHTHCQLMTSSYFEEGQAFKHAHLADWGLLTAATGAALSIAHLQIARSGPLLEKDRVSCMAGLSECAHLLRHIFDGSLDSATRRRVDEHGCYTARHLCGLALHRIFPDLPLPVVERHHVAMLAVAPQTTGLSKQSIRAKVMVIIAQLQRPLQALFLAQQRSYPELEFESFVRDVSVMLHRLLAAMPPESSRQGDASWIVKVRDGLLCSDSTRSAVRVVGTEFFELIATTLTGCTLEPVVLEEGLEDANPDFETSSHGTLTRNGNVSAGHKRRRSSRDS